VARVNDPAPKAERHPLGEPLPLRVGFAGERGRTLYGDGVRATTVQSPGDVTEVDVLIAEPDSAESLIDAAHDVSAVVLGLAEGTERVPGADAHVGAPAPDVIPAAPTLDPTVFNPTAFRDAGVAGLASLITRTGSGFEPGFDLIAGTTHDEPVTVLAPIGADLPATPPGANRVTLEVPDKERDAVKRAGDHLGVLDHPSFHASELERAGWIARLCAAGVPVVAAEISESLGELLGAELKAILGELRARDLADPDARERASVALRRAALRDHSAQARWRQICAAAQIPLPGRPMVSVVFATRRMSWLEHGIAQVSRQSYEPRELIVCLHGDEFPEGTAERIREIYEGPLKILPIDGELTLGDALNAGVEASEGELVTKMDDDDYYSTEHLWDLVLALEYARADLVGKGAEFVYLQWIDLTMRRFMGDGESTHPRLAGGSMMARKGPLKAIGGWPSRSRGEDTMLVRNFKDSGRKTYRTHGFGYILNRHGQDHTWNTYVDYFLIQSQREWRGLRFDESAID